jgi:carboxypeptidase PM20D1
LQQRQFEARLLPTQRQLFETIAPELPFGRRVALSNLWLTAPLVAGMLADQREIAPQVRTTIAPTIIEAGVKDNVLPTTARAVVNFRILPGDSIASVTAHVRKAIADKRIAIEPLDRITTEPTPLSRRDGVGFKLLAATAGRYFPDALVVPSLTTGATDARHFRQVAADTYRFVPRLFDKTDVKRVHGIDERASVAGLPLMVQAYRYLLMVGAGSAN